MRGGIPGFSDRYAAAYLWNLRSRGAALSAPFLLNRLYFTLMKKFLLFACAALLLGGASCKTQTCPAYGKAAPAAPVKPAAVVRG